MALGNNLRATKLFWFYKWWMDIFLPLDETVSPIVMTGRKYLEWFSVSETLIVRISWWCGRLVLSPVQLAAAVTSVGNGYGLHPAGKVTVTVSLSAVQLTFPVQGRASVRYRTFPFSLIPFIHCISQLCSAIADKQRTLLIIRRVTVCDL